MQSQDEEHSGDNYFELEKRITMNTSIAAICLINVFVSIFGERLKMVMNEGEKSPQQMMVLKKISDICKASELEIE